MTEPSSLKKRITRHVVGPDHEFFIVTEPHLGNICLEEVKSILPHVPIGIPVSGGVSFTGRLEDCYLANLKLKTANRVLMRLADFKATNFLQLEKKIRDIPWELYISAETGIQIHVTTRQSRLYHGDAVKERVLAAVTGQMPGLAFSETGQQVFMRGIEDRFTVSLDSTGELLYKRGIKTSGHRAPIRETLAAASLLTAGYKPDMPFADPMCGSGTFSIEAAFMAKGIPSGWFRKFAFMRWPAFKQRQWDHIKKQERQKWVTPPQPCVYASDVDALACGNLIASLSETPFSKIIAVTVKDFFSVPTFATSTPGLVAINPPYGLRLDHPGNTRVFFKQIITHLIKHYGNWRFILIVPDKALLQDIPFPHEVLPVFHGGLTVYIATGII